MVDLPTPEQVFGARRAPSAQRAVTGPRTGLVQEAQQQAGQRLSQAVAVQERAGVAAGEQISQSAKLYTDMSAEIGAKQEKRNQEARKLNLAKAQSYVLAKTTELETALKNDPEYQTTPAKYVEQFGEVEKEALNFLDPEDKELFSYALQDMRVKGKATFDDLVYKKEGQRIAGEAVQTEDAQKTVISQKLMEGDVSGAKASLQVIENTYRAAQSAGAYEGATDNGESVILNAKTNAFKESLKELPAQVKLDVIGHDNSKQALIMETVRRSEGTTNVTVDGASGAPSIFGINQKWHPEAYTTAKTIANTEGPEAGLKYATDFYQKEYWDKNNLDKYDPDTAEVLFDGVINHGSKFGAKLLAEADAGASPRELIEMRRKEYNRLGANEKYKPDLPGWMNRLTKLEKSINSSALRNLIPPDERAELTEQSLKSTIAEAIDKDPNAALLGLEEGTLGYGLEPEKLNTFKAQARTAVDSQFERAESVRLADEINADRELAQEVLAGPLPLQRIQEIENQKGETALTRLARSKYKEPDQAKVPDTVKAQTFLSLQDKLSEIVGDDPDNTKVTLTNMAKFKVFQDEAFTALSERKISPSEYESFIKPYAQRVLQQIDKGSVSQEGSGFLGEWSSGVQNPYKLASSKIEATLAQKGLDNDLLAKRDLLVLFSQNLGADYAPSNFTADNQKIQTALTSAIEQFNSTYNPKAAAKKATMVVPDGKPVELQDTYVLKNGAEVTKAKILETANARKITPGQVLQTLRDRGLME